MAHPLTDNCERCHIGNAPTRYNVNGDEITAQYRCRTCLWSWTCAWDRRALTAGEQAALIEEAHRHDGEAVRWRDVIGPAVDAVENAGRDPDERPKRKWVTDW